MMSPYGDWGLFPVQSPHPSLLSFHSHHDGRGRPSYLPCAHSFSCSVSHYSAARGGESGTPQADAFLAYADLPGLAQTHHQGLQNELALLQAEQATPRLLDEQQRLGGDDSPVDLVDTFNSAFNPSSLKYAHRCADKLFDGPKFPWDPINLQRAFRLRQEFDPQRLSIREAVAQPNANLRVQLSRGVGMDLDFIDAARLYNRLEMFQAAQQLTDGNIAGAIETLAAMLALTQRLGEQKLVVARMAAVENRREARQILQTIVMHTGANASHLQQLRTLVDDQLRHWPADADCWIGDRAVGLHTYEMIRDGQLLSILTEEEIVQYQQDGTLAAFAAAAGRWLDGDEHFYLTAMRKIIDACGQPFPQRRRTFDDIQQELNERRQSPEYPLVADRLLLQGIEDGQRRQAADRAWAEAWAIALHIALNDRSSPAVLNPLTGKEFPIHIDERQAVVTRIDPLEADAEVIVPLLRAERVSDRGDKVKG